LQRNVSRQPCSPKQGGAWAVFYVYIIRIETRSEQTHVGFTEDLKQRLATRNQGGSPHNAKFSPWQVVFFCAFLSKAKALLNAILNPIQAKPLPASDCFESGSTPDRAKVASETKLICSCLEHHHRTRHQNGLRVGRIEA